MKSCNLHVLDNLQCLYLSESTVGREEELWSYVSLLIVNGPGCSVENKIPYDFTIKLMPVVIAAFQSLQTEISLDS